MLMLAWGARQVCIAPWWAYLAVVWWWTRWNRTPKSHKSSPCLLRRLRFQLWTRWHWCLHDRRSRLDSLVLTSAAFRVLATNQSLFWATFSLVWLRYQTRGWVLLGAPRPAPCWSACRGAQSRILYCWCLSTPFLGTLKSIHPKTVWNLSI